MYHDEIFLPFSEITVPVRNTPQGQETLSYFKLFFTDEIIEEIVLETNKYRNQLHIYNSFLREHANPEEISAFIGLTLTYKLFTFIRILI